jgi:hypothetical protein
LYRKSQRHRSPLTVRGTGERKGERKAERKAERNGERRGEWNGERRGEWNGRGTEVTRDNQLRCKPRLIEPMKLSQ